MRFRNLRIAWSVFWGAACVLMVALWARSYRWQDTCHIASHLELRSLSGRLSVDIAWRPYYFEHGSYYACQSVDSFPQHGGIPRLGTAKPDLFWFSLGEWN